MKFISSFTNKDLSGEICLLRVDFNLDYNEAAAIKIKDKKTWPLRLSRSLPTIKFLLNRGAKILILSHRGDPIKKIKNPASKLILSPNEKKEFSLKFAADFLSKVLGKETIFFDDFNFKRIKKNIDKAPAKSVFLLENLRFLDKEEKNDKQLSNQLASLGTFYVNDAFGAIHRNHCSIAALAKRFRQNAYMGILIEEEIKNLSRVAKNQKKPFVVILGGAKVSDKIGVIKNFASKADYFLVGGGIANTLFKLNGLPIGYSLCDKNTDFKILAPKLRRKIILPEDTIIYKRQILDIGPKTAKKYAEIIKKAKTIIWNGPMGMIEDKRFSKGSEAIVKAIFKSRAFAVIGGGETIALLKTKNYKLKTNIFISTGGGAMLKYLAAEKLPGLKALS